ncbi:hypothetical protein ACOSP7_014125 [Xanthoceras sorbifolium]
MLKTDQPSTSAPASPPSSSASKDASKHAKKKQKVVEESSLDIEIFLPADATAFDDYKALIQGADQFVLSSDARCLRDSGVLNTIDRRIASAFQKKELDNMKLEELRRKNVERVEELEKRVV